ncbi:MAG: hypothetical protein EPN21_14620 [Methylococcaceae bacterium]|nr:MAG: hypothetical protein EPN21_14620 [Methylococcaceae bacterium]
MKRGLAVMLALVVALVFSSEAPARAHSRHSASHRSGHHAKSSAKRKPAAKTTRQTAGASETEVEDGTVGEDFEQSAAEWREWLSEREEERRHNGESMDDMAPDMAGQSWPDLDQALPSSRGSRSASASSYRQLRGKNSRLSRRLTGRQRYMLDPTRPLNLMSTPSQPVDLHDLSTLEFYDPTRHSTRSTARSKAPSRKKPQQTKSQPGKPQPDKPQPSRQPQVKSPEQPKDTAKAPEKKPEKKRDDEKKRK